MKVLLVFCAVAAIAAAGSLPTIDYASVKPMHEMPGFIERYPMLKGLNALSALTRFGSKNANTQRIVGGTEAERNSFPYQAGLFLHMEQGTGFCGGSIVSTRYILTAAHCVDVIDSATILLGAHDVTNANEEGQIRIQSDDFIIHAEWTPELIRNDIAMIRTPESIEYNSVIQPVRLPNLRQVDTTFAQQLGTVSGWGRFSDDLPDISPVLRTVSAPIMTNAACNIRFLGLIQPTNICTSGNDGLGSCQGDSGGPLTVTDADGATTQTGVVSFGLALGCERGWPSVYVRISQYLLWIAGNSDVVIREDF